MNIKVTEPKLLNTTIPLFESHQQNQIVGITDEDKIEKVFKLKANQFTFDCGTFMGTIPSEVSTKFGLLYHIKGGTFESFIESIEQFLSNSGNTLTESDVVRLQKHYKKHVL